MRYIYILSFSGVDRRIPLAFGGLLRKIVMVKLRISMVNSPAPGRKTEVSGLLHRLGLIELPENYRALIFANIHEEDFYGFEGEKFTLLNVFPLRTPEESSYFRRVTGMGLRALSISLGLKECYSDSCLLKPLDSFIDMDTRESLCDSCRAELSKLLKV